MITIISIGSMLLFLLGFIILAMLLFHEQIEWTVSMIVRLFYLIDLRIKGTEEWKMVAHCTRYVQEYKERQYQRNDDRAFLDRIGYHLNAEIDEYIIRLELGK